MFSTINLKLTVGTLAIALLLICSVLLYKFDHLPTGNVMEQTSADEPMLNETFLLSAINALEAIGGQIVLKNDLTIMGQDVLLPSNVMLSGANSKITIFLVGKRLEVAGNAANVTVKDLTIDASGLGERYGFVIGQGATSVQLENVGFHNYAGNSGCLLNMGSQVTLNNVFFTNVTNAYPIRISGSNVSVRNCNSSDNSTYALIAVGGGISDIYITGNSAVNRPLLAANYGTTPSKNLWLENNTVYFPNGTYGVLIMGGKGDFLQVSHENVIVKSNFFRAGAGAFNAIAIYGLTRNVLVVGNTVDQSLSGHNGIGISSGVNVTVAENVVYGSVEPFEGGIEVESNPVHNRRVGFSENVTVTGNTVFNSTWGVYVRVMTPEHPNWNGTILRSKNILIENNLVFGCGVGVNLLHGDGVTVRNNNIGSNTVPFAVDVANVFNYTVTRNLGYP